MNLRLWRGFYLIAVFSLLTLASIAFAGDAQWVEVRSTGIPKGEAA